MSKWDSINESCATNIIAKEQFCLFKWMQWLFPDQQVLFNFRHPHFVLRKTFPHGFEMDIFVPGISLAIEYHGQQHFHWNFRYGSPGAQWKRDEFKRKICENFGITMIESPYWWYFHRENLMETIYKRRPDLLIGSEYSTSSAIKSIKPPSLEVDLEKVFISQIFNSFCNIVQTEIFPWKNNGFYRKMN